MVKGYVIFNGMAVINVVHLIQLGVIKNQGHCIKDSYPYSKHTFS